MSSTRYAGDGDQLSQERWSSAPEFNDAINALLAAKRIALVKDPAIREMLWFLQARSLRPVGLKTLAADLLAKFPGRVGTPSMRQPWFKAGRSLKPDHVKKLAVETPFGERSFPFETHCWDQNDNHYVEKHEYSANDFIKRVREASEYLSAHLVQLCINPKIDFESGFSLHETNQPEVWYFDRLIESLIEYRQFETAASEKLARTEISDRIFATLDFCQRRRRMALIEGRAGLGKSATIKAWCEMTGGLARYVEIPSSGDDRSFYSAIAESLGVARGPSYNGQQIKLRVEEALKQSGLLLILDEAQFCWPQFRNPRGTPSRMQWVKTAFDFGVPIVLVGLPEFTKWQTIYAKKTLWPDEQFVRRLNRTVILPESHSTEDLLKIARVLHPRGNNASWTLLAGYARATAKKQASAITEALESAIDIAEQDGRDTPTFEDIEAAISLDFQPLETTAPADATAEAKAVTHKACTRRAKSVQRRRAIQPTISRARMEVSHS